MDKFSKSITKLCVKSLKEGWNCGFDHSFRELSIKKSLWPRCVLLERIWNLGKTHWNSSYHLKKTENTLVSQIGLACGAHHPKSGPHILVWQPINLIYNKLAQFFEHVNLPLNAHATQNGSPPNIKMVCEELGGNLCGWRVSTSWRHCPISCGPK